MHTTGASFLAALALGMFPFIVADVVKGVLAILIARFIYAQGLWPHTSQTPSATYPL